MTQTDTTRNDRGQTDRGDERQTGIQRREQGQMDRAGGQLRTFGDPEWHRGVGGQGEPNWAAQRSQAPSTASETSQQRAA